MASAAIKGSAMASIVGDLHSLESRGGISSETLGERLQPEDIHLLRSELEPTAWYPIDSYERMLELLFDVEGQGDVGYLQKRGRIVAQRLAESGLHPQMRLADRLDIGAQSQHLLKYVNLILSIFGSMFSVGDWRAHEKADGRVVLDMSGVQELPHLLADVILGMIQYTAERIRPNMPPYRLIRLSDSHWRYERD
jgi:hypothetical protein